MAKTSGGQLGNDNAGEGRRWREALRRALSRVGNTIDGGLDLCATRLVAAALEGAPWALEHIAERLDGKATQFVEASVDHTLNVGESASIAGNLEKALSSRTRPSVQ